MAAVIAIAAKDVASSATTTWSRMGQASTELCSAISTIKVDAFAPFKVRAVYIVHIFDAECDYSGDTAGCTRQNTTEQYSEDRE